MDANLFTAYNYLSSAIAQAFAALIGLTAIFYIFRRQTLRTQMKEVIDESRSLLALYEKNRIKKNDTQIPDRKEDLVSDQSVIEKLRDFIESKENSLADFIATEGAYVYLARYDSLEEYKNNLTVLSIISSCSSMLTILASISALLFGSKLQTGQHWFIMIGESILAALTLLFTVALVIYMFIDPKERVWKKVGEGRYLLQTKSGSKLIVCGKEIAKRMDEHIKKHEGKSPRRRKWYKNIRIVETIEELGEPQAQEGKK